MGTYAESLLTPDEKVLRRERQHPVALILDSWLAIILWTATLIMFILLIILPSGGDIAYGGDFLGDDVQLPAGEFRS